MQMGLASFSGKEFSCLKPTFWGTKSPWQANVTAIGPSKVTELEVYSLGNQKGYRQGSAKWMPALMQEIGLPLAEIVRHLEDFDRNPGALEE